MKNIPIEKAIRKTCPLGIAARTTCHGDNCMAWVPAPIYEITSGSRVEDSQATKAITLAHKTNTDGTPYTDTIKRKTGDSKTEGHCGFVNKGFLGHG